MQTEKHQTALSMFLSRKSTRQVTTALKFPSKDLDFILKTLEGPLDIYHLILESKKPVDLNIPPTLIRVAKGDPILLKSSKKSVQTIHKNAVYEFFRLPQNPEGLPLYFYSEKHSQKICFDEKSGINNWETAPNTDQQIQKFISNMFKIPTKIRVYWKFTEGPKYFLIKNSSAFPKVLASRDKSLDEILTTKYKHSLMDYPYAGQIFKSSFNHFMPQKSELVSKKRLIRKRFCEDVRQELFKCKTLPDNVTVLGQDNVDFSIKNMMDNIVSFINNVIGRNDKKVVTDLVVDFIQDEMGNWMFLKCKAHKFDFLPTKCPIFLHTEHKKSILNVEFARGFFESMISIGGKDSKANANRNALSISSIQKRLENIDSKMDDLKKNKVSMLSINKDRLIRNYSKSCSSFQIAHKSIPKLSNPEEILQAIFPT